MSGEPTQGIWPRTIVVAAAMVAADLATKWLAVQFAGDADRWLITPRTNPELALGVVQADANPVLLAVLVLVTCGLFIHAARLTHQGILSAVGFAALASGIVANAIDRAATGAVLDWFRVGPIVLNLADVLIVWGLVAYVLASMRQPTG